MGPISTLLWDKEPSECRREGREGRGAEALELQGFCRLLLPRGVNKETGEQWKSPEPLPVECGGRAGEFVLAALVSFVQQGCELQQELKSTIDVLGKVL